MRKALITGASRGIGKAIQLLFEEKGILVLSPSRSELDLSSNISIKEYISSIGDIDILVNCAGVNNLALVEELDVKSLADMIQVNLISQTMLIKYVSEKMKKNKYGRIINFSSIWSEFSKEKRIMYSIAKAGVNGLTRSIAVEMSQYNILCNAIAPGFVNTEMTYQNNTQEQMKELAQALPIKRLAQPIEIAQLAYFLAGENNTFITGQTIFIDGGFSCV